MKKIKYIIVALALGAVATSNAQQLPATSLYTTNLYGINSAYAGSNGCIEGYASHLSKFINVEGAPRTNYLGVHTAFKDNMGLGLRLTMDNTEVVDRFNGEFIYSYMLKLGEEQNLRLGLALGFYQVKLSVANAIVEDLDDEVITGGDQSAITFSDEFSLLYTNKKLQVGLAIPQILETSTKFNFATSEGSFRLRRHLIGYAGYDYEINDNWGVQPSLMFRYIGSSNNQFDINAQATYRKMFSLGLGYRTNTGLLARFGAQLMDMFSLNYVYEFPGSNISGFSSGSHEIMLGVRFCKDSGEEDVPKDILEEETPAADVPEEQAEPAQEEVVEEPANTGGGTSDPGNDASSGNNGGAGGADTSPSGGGATSTEQIIANLTPAEKEVIDVKVIFPLNEDVPNAAFNAKMDKVIAFLNKYEELNLKVVGHACDRGSAEIKQQISEDRAVFVKEYFIGRGIAPSRIQAVGVSDSEPKYPNTTEENREKNRRVEFYIE